MLKPLQARFGRRRWLGVAITLIIVSALLWSVHSLNQSLRHSSFFSGYLLLGSFVVLAALGMRKRLSFLPGIGNANAWMQVHIYVGLGTFALFGMHLGWHVPNGIFECTLAMLFLIVGGSGIYGLAITRLYPKRLTSVGGEVVFETIPGRRIQLARQARALVLKSSQSTDVLARFYMNHLAEFLEQPRGWLYWLAPNGNLKRQLLGQIGELDRYLAEEDRQFGKKLSAIVEDRDRLDYHHALQSRLKLWLFVHIGFTYSLLLFSFVHMFLAHAFWGGN